MTDTANTLSGALLPLDLPERIIALRIQNTDSIRRHVFRRVDRPDVDAYYSAILIATQRSGQTSEDEIDVGTAEMKLYERAIVRVEGYFLSDRRNLMELPNWKTRVPGGHRISATDMLMKVTKSVESGDGLLDPDYDVVSLDACWTERNEGQMDWYRGLLHRFTPPDISHWKKLNTYKTRSVAVGGSRSQRTIYPKLDGALGDLYDELIVSVDGYSFKGNALTDRETIIREMDRFHKVSAVSSLFDRSGADASEAE